MKIQQFLSERSKLKLHSTKIYHKNMTDLQSGPRLSHVTEVL